MSEYTDETAGGDEVPPDAPMADVAAPTAKARRTLIGPFTARQLGIVNAVVFGTALVLFVATRPLGGAGPTSAADPGATFYRISAETQGLDLGQRAPELTGDDGGKPTKLMDTDGRLVTLASLKGHPVWINFWATWCPPCQRETPVLRDAYEAHKGEGLVLVAIDVQEDADTVRRYGGDVWAHPDDRSRSDRGGLPRLPHLRPAEPLLHRPRRGDPRPLFRAADEGPRRTAAQGDLGAVRSLG